MMGEDMGLGLVKCRSTYIPPKAPASCFRSLSLKTTDLGPTMETMVGEDMDLGLAKCRSTYIPPKATASSFRSISLKNTENRAPM